MNRKDVPTLIKKTELKVGEMVCVESDGIIIMKWKDKKKYVPFISTFHDTTITSKINRQGLEKVKPKCIHEYNCAMGGVDLKDHKFYW